MAKGIEIGNGTVNKKLKSGVIGTGTTNKKLKRVIVGTTSGNKVVWIDYVPIIYIGCDVSLGEVRKVDETGNRKWLFADHTNRVMSIAVDKDGYVYTASQDSTFRKLSPDGVQSWQQGNTSWGTLQSVSVDKDGYVYVGGDSSKPYLYKINPATQSADWTNTTDFQWIINSIKINSGGEIFATAGYYGELLKLNTSGDKVWKYTTTYGGQLNGLALDKNNNSYLAESNKRLEKINASGGLVWEYTDNTASLLSAAVDKDGNCYICISGTTDNLKKINASGAKVWAISIPSGVNKVTVDKNGNIYVASYGKVTKYDTNQVKVWEYADTPDIGNVYSLAISPGDIAVYPELWV